MDDSKKEETEEKKPAEEAKKEEGKPEGETVNQIDEKVKTTPTNDASQSDKPVQKSGSSVALIIIIIVLVLIILGVGGYFAFSYFVKKSAESLLVTPTTTATATATATLTSTTTVTTVAASADYILPDSNARLVSQSELTTLTPWQLKVGRNEIYARHGREFVHKDLQCYFKSKTWYGIDPIYSESSLSVVENKNVATILAYEKQINSPILEKDTGCNTNK